MFQPHEAFLFIISLIITALAAGGTVWTMEQHSKQCTHDHDMFMMEVNKSFNSYLITLAGLTNDGAKQIPEK